MFLGTKNDRLKEVEYEMNSIKQQMEFMFQMLQALYFKLGMEYKVIPAETKAVEIKKK